jgi:hypothetical protein
MMLNGKRRTKRAVLAASPSMVAAQQHERRDPGDKVRWPDEYPDFPESGGFTAELVRALEDLGLVFIFADGNHDGALGGAYSIDKAFLTSGWDWFEGEEVIPADVETLGFEPLDVLITHDVPAGIDVETTLQIPEAIERESYIVRSLLRDAVRNTEPKLVFSGHWHQRRTGLMPGMDTRVHVLDREFHNGNLVSLDLATLAVEEYKAI